DCFQVCANSTSPMEPPPAKTEPKPRPSSKSNLAPWLRSRGELQRPAGRRKPGRRPVQAPWFQAVATVMSGGTPLREALSRCGVYGLSNRQIRALYRNTVLKAMREVARQKWLRLDGITSVVTSKLADDGQGKTGQREWA